MKTRYLALIVAVGGLVLGCKTDPNIPILERELRKQEDEIYKLQDCVEQSKRDLEACRRENATLRGNAHPATSSTASGEPSTTNSSAPPPAAAAPEAPQIELPGNGTTRMPDSLDQPNVAPPSSRETPPTYKSPADLAPPYSPGSAPAPDAAPLYSPEPGPTPPDASRSNPPRLNMNIENRPLKTPKVDSAYVERIAINPNATGPYGSAATLGDQGLAVLVETRNVRGQLVRAAAPISVVALDPALHGEAARLARWDFSAAEVAAMFRAVAGVEGVYLQLRWPAGPPKHNALEVYVRLVAGDGRKLETHRSVAMDFPARSQRQWASTAAATPGAVPLPARNTAKPDGWQQLPPSAMPGPAPLAVEPDAVPAPLIVGPQLEAPTAQAKKSAAKPAESKAELPVWSPYR
jgi:hypothetical protein